MVGFSEIKMLKNCLINKFKKAYFWQRKQHIIFFH